MTRLRISHIVAGAVLLACSDIADAPPRGAVAVYFSPSYGDPALVAASADQLRIRVETLPQTKTEQLTLVVDTTVAIDPATGEARADVTVPLDQDPQTFLVRLDALRGADGVVLFSGSQTVVVTGGDTGGQPISIPVTYVGPRATRLTVTPSDTGVQDGDSFTFFATVFDAQDRVIDVPVTFDLVDPTDASVLTVDRRTGLAQAAAGASGVVEVLGRTLDSPPAMDTARVFVGGFSSFVIDPSGDTFDQVSTQQGLVPPDIVRFGAQVVGGSLIIQLDFVEVVTPPGSPDTAHVVVGFIDIDTDQNMATGTPANTDGFGGTSGMGVEYFITLFFLDSLGQVQVTNTVDFLPAGNVTPQYVGSSLIIDVPLSILGGDDGNLNMATVLGTIPEPTDIAPNMGHLTVGSGSALRALRVPPADRVQSQKGWGNWNRRR